MTKRAERWVAIATIAAFVQMGCYNTYFISKDELEKLESGVEVKEVVTVHGDCATSGSVASPGVEERGTYAKAGSSKGSDSKSGDSNSSNEKASDATPPSKEAAEKSKSSAPSGCTEVPVSTANALHVVLDNGEKRRVTPFNFMMSRQQLVAPEYDLLVSLDRVDGARVREFSTWKTIGTIAGVTAVTVGTFVGISLTSDERQF